MARFLFVARDPKHQIVLRPDLDRIDFNPLRVVQHLVFCDSIHGSMAQPVQGASGGIVARHGQVEPVSHLDFSQRR